MSKRHILVIRLSALGDVAMLYPVIYNVLEGSKDVRITLLTRPQMAPIFAHLSRVNVVSVDTNGKHKGLLGILRLYRSLSSLGITAVVDVHNVLRSRLLGHLFRLRGIPVHVLDKQREERNMLVRKNNKKRRVLIPVVERYRNVFMRAGVEILSTDAPPIHPRSETPHGVGFAPFAGFLQKELPWTTVASTVKKLSQEGFAVYLFSAPGKQREQLKTLTDFPNVSVVSLSGGLKEELAFMASLKIMISMDSANGHLASLVNCPVISIWGATHRDAGFAAQKVVHHIEISTKELPCRPCSAFGSAPCHRGDLACLNRIEVDAIVRAVNQAVL